MGSDQAQRLYDELKQTWSTGKDEQRTIQLLSQLKVSWVTHPMHLHLNPAYLLVHFEARWATHLRQRLRVE
jgi:hypothetical protein